MYPRMRMEAFLRPLRPYVPLTMKLFPLIWVDLKCNVYFILFYSSFIYLFIYLYIYLFIILFVCLFVCFILFYSVYFIYLLILGGGEKRYGGLMVLRRRTLNFVFLFFFIIIIFIYLFIYLFIYFHFCIIALIYNLF